MTEKEVIFPSWMAPHSDLLPRHAAMMSTVQSLLQRLPALRILEIGSWCGASALLWAESISHYGTPEQVNRSSITCVDAWNPVFTTEDMKSPHYGKMCDAARDDAVYKVFCHNIDAAKFKFGVNIGHIRGQSEDVLPDLDPDSFDVIYIDGSHYYDDVLLDIEYSKKILANDGVICGDDLEVELKGVDKGFIKRSLHRDYVQDPISGAWFHPGVTLAVAESFPTIGAYHGFWCVRKVDSQCFVAEHVDAKSYFFPSFLTEIQRTYFAGRMNEVTG